MPRHGFVTEPLDREYSPGQKAGQYTAGIDLQELHGEIMAKWIERKKWLKDNNTWNRLEHKVRRDQLYRRLQKEKEERMLQDCICKAEKDKCHRKRQIIQETNFAEAMKEVREDEVRDYAFRKQLFACVPEIRDLEHELRRAYHAKTLHAQCLEKEARDFEEKVLQHEYYEIVKESLLKFDQEAAEKERERMKMKCDYRKQLEHQLTDASSKTFKEKEDSERDRQAVDEIIEMIKQEELEDLIEKTNKVKLYQSEINNFLEARENQKQRDKARQKREEERDEQYLNTKEEQKAAFNQARAERDKAKAAIVAKAVETMMQAQFQAEEMEDLRNELCEEELAESIRRKEAEETEKRCRAMMELRAAEAEGRQMRAEKVAAEKAEEEKFKQEQLLKFAEDDRLELLGQAKRRQMVRQHQTKVEYLLVERRARKAAEKEKELELRHCAEEAEKRRQDLIDSERIKLLKEHGPKLLGFIPRGTIKSQEELDQLGEPFLTYYRDGAQFREPAPFTIGATPCEEELYRNMELPKNAKY